MAHDELVIEHYGVKGMKWGVRKTKASQLIDSVKNTSVVTYVREHKKQIAIAAGVITAVAGVALYQYGKKAGYIENGQATHMIQQALRSPMTKNIKSGTTVQRASRGKMELRNERTYFTTKMSDHKKYLTDATATNFRDTVGNNTSRDMNSVTMRVKQNLKAPSERKQVTEFLKFLDKNPDMVADSIASHVNGGKFLDKDYSKKVSSQIKSMNKAQKGTKLYKQFKDSLVEGTQGPESKAARDAFWNELKKQGYNSVTDHVDKGSGFAKNPMIAFNAKESFDIVSEMPLSEAIKKFR